MAKKERSVEDPEDLVRKRNEIKFMSEHKFVSEHKMLSTTTGATNDYSEEVEVEVYEDEEYTCKCENVFNEFMLEHDECLALYDEYKFQTLQRLDDYFHELAPDTCGCLDQEKYPSEKKPDGLCDIARAEHREETCKAPTPPQEPKPCLVPCPCPEDKEEDTKPEKVKCDCKELLEDDDGCICLKPEPDEPFWDYKMCECSDLTPCTCKKGKAEEKKGKKKKVKGESEPNITVNEQDPRIFVIEKFPKSYHGQMKLLKV